MIQTWDCAEARPSLGVYVLGAIEPAERTLVDNHLATCRDCRDELAGLAGLPALLARVSPEEVSRITADDVQPVVDERPSEDLLGTVIDLAAARRRKNNLRYIGAAAAAAAIAVGAFAGLQTAGTRTVACPAVVKTVPDFQVGTNTWETVSGRSSTTGAAATVAYSPVRWGYALATKVSGIPVNTTCDMWVVHPDGSRTHVANWTTASDEGDVWYWGSMASTAKPINGFEVTAGNRVLVTVSAN